MRPWDGRSSAALLTMSGASVSCGHPGGRHGHLHYLRSVICFPECGMPPL